MFSFTTAVFLKSSEIDDLKNIFADVLLLFSGRHFEIARVIIEQSI